MSNEDMEMIGRKKKTEVPGIGLSRLVFSWSLRDILNKNLYKDEVKRIPEVFSSMLEYTRSFKLPLMEETRASLCSGIESVGQAPACEVTRIELSKDHEPPKELYYNIWTKKIKDFKISGGHYEPEAGDLVVLTMKTKPRRIEDLIKPGEPLILALMSPTNDDSDDMMKLLSSQKIDSEFWPRLNDFDEPVTRIFATYVDNLITNMRIWSALNPDPVKSISSALNPNPVKSINFVRNVLRPITETAVDFNDCFSDESDTLMDCKVLEAIESFKLDESQKAAVLSSIAMRNDISTHAKAKVKFIWGPPGTGKTKTVASLLFSLFRLKCRTLACAPTNIAVLQVAIRFMGLLSDSLECDTYGLGDVIIFGNGGRMKVGDHDEILDIFLDYRAEVLSYCLSPFCGWKHTLDSLISLIEDPEKQYLTYSINFKSHEKDPKSDYTQSAGNSRTKGKAYKKNDGKRWKDVIDQSLKESYESIGHVERLSDELMSFEEFVRKRFYSLGGRMALLIKYLYTHLPTSLLALDVVRRMITICDLLEILKDAGKSSDDAYKIVMERDEFLRILKSLPDNFLLPIAILIDLQLIKEFCLKNARLIFCTASSSARMQRGGMGAVEMLVVDEAAQLKECESLIPLQLPGLRNAVFIGDDRQLPAMVQSKVADNANFGRSLFERLSKLGQKKHLLNVQMLQMSKKKVTKDHFS